MGIKKSIRKLFKVREYETFRDAADRYRTRISKVFFRRKYSGEELKAALERAGLCRGDTVLVHAAWRNFYNFSGTPEEAVGILWSIVGETGTIMMPCYGNDRSFLDIRKTPSAAGVLSETFRTMEGVKRSHCTHFTVAVKGRNEDLLISEHGKSTYGFDRYSPCFKLAGVPDSKVLFLGLGKVPVKISIFHCAGALLSEEDPKLRQLLSRQYRSVLVDEFGIERQKDMVIRIPGHGNDEKVFRKIFGSIEKRRAVRISNLDIVAIDAKEALDRAVEYARSGIYCYKNMSGIQG